MNVDTLTPEQLHGAVAAVLVAAGYDVKTKASLYGTEIDILAEKRGAALPEVLCIEVTVSHVDVEKYGKDLTHFAVIREEDPEARCIMVSSQGFAPRTLERATKARVRCWTYSEFRRRFIATAAYEDLVVGPDDAVLSIAPQDPNAELPLWRQVRDLAAVYQDPRIVTQVNGQVKTEPSALAWFDGWLKAPTRQWVSLIGDYGSGKTALTKMLLLRWMRDFRRDGGALPIRIELRDFATKFDYEGLLIHFWRRHALDAMPIRTLEMLIEEGRVVFILDGFDEMAQNLSLVDRRNCLTALAKAISGRSSGIITSRPNYFTEAEELRVVELLYRRAGNIRRLDESLALNEEKVDKFLQRYFLDRQDARLHDLSPTQIEELLSARLVKEPQLKQNVRGIIQSIYGLDKAGQTSDSLASKPVIITYLLEVAENLDSGALASYRPLDDWGIYRLILDKLVMRDQGRTSGIVLPSERRQFLQELAVELSVKRLPHADRELMLKHVNSMFGREIKRLGDASVSVKEDLYFTDLRSSASLTSANEQWRFSHASLREFLVAEAVIERVLDGRDLSVFTGLIPSSGMVKFLAKGFDHFPDLMVHVTSAYTKHPEVVLNLFIPAALARGPAEGVALLEKLAADKRVSGVIVSGTRFSKVNFDGWRFDDMIFDRCEFEDVVFTKCRFLRTDFADSQLLNVTFKGGEFIQGGLDGLSLEHCTMQELAIRFERKILLRARNELLTEERAKAYLRFIGADIAPGQPLNTWQFSRRWNDFNKVMSQLLDGDRAFRQYLGLTQKGGVQDPSWTRSLVDLLTNKELLEQQSDSAVRVHPDRLADAHRLWDGEFPEYLERMFKR